MGAEGASTIVWLSLPRPCMLQPFPLMQVRFAHVRPLTVACRPAYQPASWVNHWMATARAQSGAVRLGKVAKTVGWVLRLPDQERKPRPHSPSHPCKGDGEKVSWQVISHLLSDSVSLVFPEAKVLQLRAFILLMGSPHWRLDRGIVGLCPAQPGCFRLWLSRHGNLRALACPQWLVSVAVLTCEVVLSSVLL